MMKENLNQRHGGLGTEHRGGEPRIRPYVLCAISRVFAIAVAIPRVLIGVWDRPRLGNVDPGVGQQGRAQVQKYPR